MSTGESRRKTTPASDTAHASGYALDVRVTAADREHFRRIAAAMAAERAERTREDLAKPAMQRIVEGLAAGQALPTSAEREALLDARALGQAELQARARRLGLRR